MAVIHEGSITAEEVWQICNHDHFVTMSVFNLAWAHAISELAWGDLFEDLTSNLYPWKLHAMTDSINAVNQSTGVDLICGNSNTQEKHLFGIHFASRIANDLQRCEEGSIEDAMIHWRHYVECQLKPDEEQIHFY